MFEAAISAKNQLRQTPLSLPARLHAEDAARVLGFQALDIPVLIAVKLLRPLGNPAPNAIKYSAEVQPEDRR
jgi:hypothetical protein